MNLEKHEMILENTHSSGAEEWFCPTCGRRMTITWHPWKKIVLEEGDMYAAHSATKNGMPGMQIGSINVTQGNGEDEQSSNDLLTDDPYLAPWMHWLENVDLDELGKGDD